MAEFSLDIDEIKKDVEDTLKEEEVKLENSNIKNQAEENAAAIFETDFSNPNEREKIIKPIESFGMDDMSKSAARNEMLATRFVDLSKGGKDADNIGDKLAELDRQMKDLDPADEKVQVQVKKLQDYITANFYHCTDEILAGLGQMYVCDKRFKNNIDKNGDGTAKFINDAIEIYCRK